MTKSSFIKSVSEMYGRLDFYKKMMIGSIITNAIVGLSLILTLFSDPIVIFEKDAEKLSFKGTRKEVSITENEIKKVVENFIQRRYQWEKFSQNDITSNLSSIVTKGLLEKISLEVTKQEESLKAVSQYVGKIQISLDESGNITGTFDKILRLTGKLKDGTNDISQIVEKIPLLSEAQVMVKVVRGSITEENPLGLYINSVVNYEPL